MHGKQGHNERSVFDSFVTRRGEIFAMKKMILLLGCVPFALSGCTAVSIVSGAVAGLQATQEGGISAAASDARIQIEINDLLFKYDVDTYGRLDLTVNQGRVLITGVVQDPDKRVEAVRLAWQPRGVKQVINEIRVAKSEGLRGFASDAWITSRLRAKLTLDGDVASLNYTIDTVQGTVYLMGVAYNQDELDRVIETARTISGVQQVVSYVKLAGTEIVAESVPE